MTTIELQDANLYSGEKMNARKSAGALAMMLLSMSFGLVAGSYRMEGPGAEFLSEIGLENCNAGVCDFTQPEMYSINGEEMQAIETMGDSVKLVGNSGANFVDDKMVFTYFADTIGDALSDRELIGNDAVSCKTQMVPFPSPLPAYHHVTTCMVKATLKKTM